MTINMKDILFENDSVAKLTINIDIKGYHNFDVGVDCEHVTLAEYKSCLVTKDGKQYRDLDSVKNILKSKIHGWTLTFSHLQKFVKIGLPKDMDESDVLSFKDKALYEFAMNTIPGLAHGIIAHAAELDNYPKVKRVKN